MTKPAFLLFTAVLLSRARAAHASGEERRKRASGR